MKLMFCLWRRGKPFALDKKFPREKAMRTAGNMYIECLAWIARMSNGNDTSHITIERRFDVNGNVTEEWFRSYVGELSKYGGAKEDVSCDVHLTPDLENRVAFHSRRAWSDYVLANWKNAAESDIWQYGGTVRRAHCNHRRQHVVLTVEAEDTSQVERIFEELSRTLSLAPSPQNPYRYRRSSMEFEIGNWRPDLFVAGIRKIADILGPNPDIADAWAKSFEGEIEKLTPYSDLQSFSDELGTRVSRFGEIAIRMQARSIGVGIGVTSDHKKLRIRTTLPPTEVDNLLTAWPSDLQLKQIKAADTGAELGGTAPAPAENPWLKYGIPVVVAFVTAVSVAGAISLKKAIWPEYKVTLLSPPTSNGVAKWSGAWIPIDWYLQPDQASFRGTKKGVAATVRIDSASDPEQTMESKPPLNVTLRPGSYVIVIDSPDASPLQFQLIVENPGSHASSSTP